MKNLKIFTNNIEDQATEQIKLLLEQEAFKNSKVRIMPDVHAGKGCVIGFTGDLGEKVIPNIVGVDIGCGMFCASLGKIDIDYKKLKKSGIKVLLFDLDNTCIGHKDRKASKNLVELFKKLKKKDFIVYIFSNSIDKKKVKNIASEIGVKYVYMAVKPFRFNFKKILRENKVLGGEVAIIGDQLFTDVLGGNKMGIMTILVKPVSLGDNILTKFMRRLEKIAFKKMKKKGILNK